MFFFIFGNYIPPFHPPIFFPSNTSQIPSLLSGKFTAFLKKLFYVYGCLPECRSVHQVFTECIEEGVGISGSGVRDSCGPLCECWEPNLGPLKEALML